MQTFLHYRWRVPSTLHRLHPRRIIPLLLLALCVTGAKAQSDVKFNGDIRYSKWVIDSRMNNFYANTTPCGFAVYNQEGTKTSPRVDGKDKLDYVVGLVAKSIIEASQYYSQYTWAQSFAKPWFLSIKDYGNNFYNRFRSTSGSLDDLNAVKLFIPLRALTEETKGKYPDATTYANTATALNTALTGLNTHNSSYSIKSGTTAETAGNIVAGGWWHKSDYQNQMWLDGSYMGPALFAQLVNYSNKITNIDATNDWNLIVKQFTILRNMCWNETAKLPYHAFAADGGTNSTSHSDTWEGLSSIPTYCFHSASYWGRAVGWYFLALVDVLEQMDNANLSSSEGYTILKSYLTETAEGIKARQDKATGGWYQILDKDNKYSASSYDNGQQHTTTYNYIESSATALFTAAYLKAIRLGYLANDYKTVAENGYKCLVNNFFSVDENGKVNIFGSCRSAGLGGKGDDYKKGKIKYRNGSNEYYLLGSDVARVDKSKNETEGKVLGAFIMAATEYERVNEKDIRFSYDLAPAYTLTKDQSLKVEALGSGDISYKWYNASNDSEVSGATEATFNPTESGKYYCKATSGTTTIQTSTAEVTVSGTVSNGGSGSASNLAYTKAYQDAGNAWTPAVNGTIDVSNLVTSSSKGAYSITSEGNVATIEGTTIKALTSGKFTLSQAADDKYKEGSIVITVRIGTNVISDGTNKYSFTAQTAVSDNMTITRDNITMTFGNDGFWSQASANGYTNGQRNPKDSDGKDPSAGKIPSIGTFYKFTPTKPGSLAVKIKLGTTGGEGSCYLRPLYVSENGTLIKAKDKNGTELDPEKMPAAESTYVDNVTFNVKKGKDYYVYVTGSKLGFYGFDFTPATVYTVTYNMNGHGTQIDAVTDDNTLPETLPTPTADGYTFGGWYTDAALTQEATAGAAITSDVTLYAKWTPITDLFSLTVVTSEVISVESNTAYNVKSADATVTGGSVQLYNGNSKASADMIINSQINLKGSGGSYIKITLDNTLKAGDEIIINPATSSFKLSETNSNSNAKSFTGSYVIKAEDAVVGQKEIYLYNNKHGNSVIENISISHPESDSRATFKYNGTAIAFSEKTAGDKSAYTTTLEIGASKKGETITITSSVKDGASIKQGETVVSGDITIAVPSTIGQTTTSTYTVTSKDGSSTTTYEINVKLVKENVVLEYAQREVSSSGEIINIKKEWTWDKTANSTKPTFTNPTLKVYLANADGTPSKTEVKNVTGIKYMSDVEDVATVDKTGNITIKKNANGGAKIYAILEGHSDYNDANTFFNIVVKQGYSYSVATDAEVTNGPSLNQPVYIKNGETNLVKMTFGGWKWKTFKENEDNPKLISTYEVNSSPRKDGWNKPATSDESDIASIDGYKTYISGYSDAVDESKKKSDDAIYGSTRYGWFKPAEKRSDGYLETYPYTLPVRGAYMTFEPTQNGTLTVYILQNGAWNTYSSDAEDGSYKNGDIIPGEFRPHSFYICNQRGLNADQFSPKSFTYTTKQKVQGDYYCDLTNNIDDPKNIASWKEFKDYMSYKEKQAVAAKWKSGINDAQEIVQLDNGSFLAIQKGIVKYTFFVTANETYYLFSNFSKLGFCGANFVPSETVVPANDDYHKMTLDDETAYPTIEKPVASATGEDQYKYKFGGTVKGYVEGFTIPLFKSITLNREFKKDQWTTLSLPFNLTQTEVEEIFGKGTQIIVFKDAITDGTKLHVKFFYHEIQNILPGYPYLIKPTLEGYDNGTTTQTAYAPTRTIDESGDLTSFTVYDKAINPNIEQHEFESEDKKYVAKGTPDYCTENTVTFGNVGYKYSTKYEKGDLFISDSDGKLYESAGDSYGKGYRSFIDYTGNSFASKSLTISFSGVDDSDDNGGTTEIKVAELDNGIRQALGFVGVYNLNGQKVAETTHNLPAGIYIVNGRKLVVK